MKLHHILLASALSLPAAAETKRDVAINGAYENNGAGFKKGVSIGADVNIPAGRFVINVAGDVSNSSKYRSGHDSSGYEYSTGAEARIFFGKWFAGPGIAHGKYSTLFDDGVEWKKSGTRITLSGGVKSDGYEIAVRGSFPDNTENKSWGIGSKYMRRLFNTPLFVKYEAGFSSFIQNSERRIEPYGSLGAALIWDW